MIKMHKHAGITKMHSIEQTHKTQLAITAHQLEIKKNTGQAGSIFQQAREFQEKKKLNVEIDSEGYAFFDLTKAFNIAGVRIKFQRTNGRNKKTIGLQIEK